MRDPFTSRHGRHEASNRRTFLKLVVLSGAGFTLGGWLADQAAFAAESPNAKPAPPPGAPPQAFVRICDDDTVVVIVKHLEMGQGTFTGLPTVVAEELDAAWSQVRVEAAPANAALYNNLLNGPIQVTGASTSMANSYLQYRLAAAAARSMLLSAAAVRWGVPVESITVRDGVISSRDGRRLHFGELATEAAQQTIPQSPALKDPSTFRLIGHDLQRTDARAKSTGTAIFTQDMRLPGQLTAVVAHPPRFGATLKSFDEASVMRLPGVRFVVAIPAGVAIVATDFWTAKRARDALEVTWDTTAAMTLSSMDLLIQYRGLCESPGTPVRMVGDPTSTASTAKQTVSAIYEFPYLAHATMEPMNCVIQLQKDRCEAWYAVQSQTNDQAVIAQLVGLKPDQVVLHQLFAGGSFGRRASSTPATDYVGEAASIVKVLADKGEAGVPIKLMWTREDDMRADHFRPAFVHSLEGALDPSGRLVSWRQRIVGQSVAADTLVAFKIKAGVDPYSVDGVTTMPYDIPNIIVDLHSPLNPVPVLWWRSVGSTHSAFAIETFVDRLAAAARADPVEFRRKMLGAKPRHLAVLNLAVAKAQWSVALKPGVAGARRARGVALHEAYDTVVAQIVEVTVAADNSFSVDRVVCAVDCGLAINPDVVRAQMEGGVGFALSAALYGAITIKAGAVEQSNFHDYQVIRIHEMPQVDVHLVASTAPPTGVGEPGVPPLAPAVANALAAATGQWLTRLPLTLN